MFLTDLKSAGDSRATVGKLVVCKVRCTEYSLLNKLPAQYTQYLTSNNEQERKKALTSQSGSSFSLLLTVTAATVSPSLSFPGGLTLSLAPSSNFTHITVNLEMRFVVFSQQINNQNVKNIWKCDET